MEQSGCGSEGSDTHSLLGPNIRHGLGGHFADDLTDEPFRSTHPRELSGLDYCNMFNEMKNNGVWLLPRDRNPNFLKLTVVEWDLEPKEFFLDLHTISQKKNVPQLKENAENRGAIKMGKNRISSFFMTTND